MKIRLTRPEDPELQRQYDEARKTLADRDCCVGDVTRCRCHGRAPVAMTDEDVDREKWAAVWADGGDE